MKPETFLSELEELCEQTGYRIRKERGSFRGDSCIIQGDMLIVINKSRPLDLQIGILARVLRDTDIDDIYVKPVVRKKLVEIWDRLSATEKDEPVQDTDVKIGHTEREQIQ